MSLPPHIFVSLFFVSLPSNRGTINNSMSGDFYTSSAGRCVISYASCSNPMSQHLGANRTTAGGQSLPLLRQCRHLAVHLRLYIGIHPSHPPFWFEHSKPLLVKINHRHVSTHSIYNCGGQWCCNLGLLCSTRYFGGKVKVSVFRECMYV